MSISSFEDRRLRVGRAPTGNSLTSLVAEQIPLNVKQRMVVEKVLSDALAWAEHPFDSSRRKQMLLCIMGEGGTGKSQVIKAIVTGMDLLHRKKEVILTAPTGAAADNIGGNTYHTSLGISIDRSRATSTTRSRIKRLWERKTIIIVDEVSMMDLTMLSMINNHCKMAKSLDRNSPEFFGGLPIVIFVGDFFQFSPVRGPALWRVPRLNKDEDEIGQLLWHQFTQVIILDEQMRQTEDLSFRDFLLRARSGSLTSNDLSLNSKAITSLADPQLEGAMTVVKRNSIRHMVNRIQMEKFARLRNQRIYIYSAIHTRTKSTGPGNIRLRADDLLQQPDQGATIPFPGLFLYSTGMPAVILTNICTALGQVNGAAGTAVGVVVDPSDYKGQGSTLASAILDLKDDPTIRGLDRHRKFCSTYVQLSRLRSSEGLHLLQRLDMKDLQFEPDPRLLSEIQRLQELEKQTMAAWEGDKRREVHNKSQADERPE
ncbi:hypothetical protein N7532_007154 [Penicillium argentinense]|uniref:ATP-dependent DNA helicase n=1 Tax=Penicillium argentinense TaxID=1131581 RepID=A0A9W9KBP0_9EURO|nr:uncharacterized protein N7532_007154 [Penicillium argentinense]KAJ5100153.1 hypothetical protein N7532_007154 [Penicillium argentinense]